MMWRRVFAREYSVQYCEVAIRSMSSEIKHIYPFFMKRIIFLPDNKNACAYFEETEEKKFNKVIVDKLTKDYTAFEDFVKKFYSLGEMYRDFCKTVYKKDTSKLTNEQIKSILDDYYQKAIEYCYVLWLGFLLNEMWSEKGMQITKGLEEEVRRALFRPVKKSTVLLMQEEAQKVSVDDKQAVQKFLKKYQWLPCLDIHNEPWTKEDVVEYIRNCKGQKTRKEMSFEQALKESNCDKETFQIIKELAYIKDVRDDFRRKGVFYIRPLFEEIASRFNLTIEDIAYLKSEEILALLDNKEITVSTKQRKKGFLLYYEKEELVFKDSEIGKTLKNLNFCEEEITTKEIKGLVANKGKATGQVKIILTVHDTLKVNKGDILVAVTTHPDYVPAMQKAAAIVTDEGGITSHAAIVSRELGIPCIVGTKVATKILRHLELVEVDANTGVVKKL